MQTYKIANDIRERAIKIIKDVKELNHIVVDNIIFVRTTKHIKGDHVLGCCVFLNDRTQFLSNKKYMVEFPPVFDTLKEKQQDIVIEHELYHIPLEEKGLVEHDIGEFRKIVDKYTLEWFQIYQEAESNIKLLKEKDKLLKKQKQKDDDA